MNFGRIVIQVNMHRLTVGFLICCHTCKMAVACPPAVRCCICSSVHWLPASLACVWHYCLYAYSPSSMVHSYFLPKAPSCT